MSDTTTTGPPDNEVVAPDDLEARRAAILAEKGAPESVISGVDTVQEDYFGVEITHKVYLPDGISYVLHDELMEGDRKQYLNAVNRDVKMNRKTQDVTLRTAPGDDRHALLKAAITGWNLMRQDQPIPFSEGNLSKFLQSAPPRIIDIIEKDIRKHNPWLNAEVTAQDIRDEIAQLEEMLVEKERDEAGN